jgi:hypothetical protein
LVSQIGINYRHSSLSKHAGDENFEIKAGDRMPYFLVDGESLYDKLREPKFHLIVFSDGTGDFQQLKTELENELVDSHLIPLYPQVAQVFGSSKSFSVLLRPDNHIGSITTKTSPDELKAYLNEFIGHGR